MLKGIPQIITPDMLYALAAMGHGDGLVLADANFPAYRLAGEHTLVHLPDSGISEVLKAVLTLFPIDALHAHRGYVMEVEPGDIKRGIKTPIWDDYASVLKAEIPQSESFSGDILGTVKRQDFYTEASRAELIVLTGEKAPYANLMLYKGVLN